MKAAIPSFSINRERLVRVLRSEFELRVDNFGKRPMPEAQELRGVFAHECLVQEITTFADESRVPPLQSGQMA